MRWLWLDRFTVFESGQRAQAIKNVSVAEEHIDGYFPSYPVMTPTLVIEGFAQAGGLLVGEVNNFRERVVLGKVSSARFHRYARPGETLHYAVEMESMQADGGLVKGVAKIDGEVVVEADLTFVHVVDNVVDHELFEPAEFLRMLRIFGLYDVGTDRDGNPLQIPDHLLAAELAEQNIS